jgi:hypothetical protein
VSRRREMVPLEHALAIVCAAAAGLHHAHEQRGPDRTPLGIVHRDVSPANILIGYDGGVKVADFGIAKATHRTTETRSGTLKGKVAYMSPEQCVGEAIDRRSDVFSLGIVLYELLTVRRLFKGDNDFMTMTAIVLGYIPPPSTYRPNIPSQLEEIVLKALATKPEERYQSTEELRLALEQVAANLQLSLSSTLLADYMKQMFGTRPEPWHEEDDEPEIEIGIDFDGSASGVARVPIEALPPVETMRMVALGSRPAAMPSVIAESQSPPKRISEVIELYPKQPRATTQAVTGEWGSSLTGMGADTGMEVEVAASTSSRALRSDDVDVDHAEVHAEVHADVHVEAHVELDLDQAIVVAIPAIEGGTSVPARRGRVRMLLGLFALVGSVCAFAAAIWLSRGPSTSTVEPARKAAATTAPSSSTPAPVSTPVSTPASAPRTVVSPTPAPKPASVTKPVDPAKPALKKQPPKPPPSPAPSTIKSKKWDPNTLFIE